MKTQLLEDIGQSVTSSLVPSGSLTDAIPENVVRNAPQASRARASMPRSATGVWRQKPAAKPEAVVAQEPDRHAPSVQTLPEADAATAAIPMAEQLQPAAPANDIESPPLESTSETKTPLDGPIPPDPLFDFSPRLSDSAAELPASETGWLGRSGQRYVLWSSCALAAAVTVAGGWWLHSERKDAGSLALVANEFKPEPPTDRVARRRALAAKEFTLGADGEVRVSPAPAESPVTRPSSVVPPLVLLPAESASTQKNEQTSALAPDPVSRSTTLEPEVTVDEVPAPPPKRVRSSERKLATATQGRTNIERAPSRQSTRPSVAQTGTSKPVADTTVSATLKACRAYGYNAAQCVKRACSVTKFGFVCRGR